MSSITYKFTQRYKPQPAVIRRDMIVVREDGSLGIVKAGTPINIPVGDGPIKTEIKS